MMRKLCPNLDREDGLDTVLEVPIPEETFASYTHSKNTTWQDMMKSWIKPQADRSLQQPPPPVFGARNTEIQLLLGVAGAPLIPLPIRSNQTANRNINDHCIESSMAKYIVQQYIAASGGEKALNSIDSMYAMGKVQMVASEFINGDCSSMNYKGQSNSTNKVMKMKNRTGVMGGFVLWQKRPELWCLELMVSGCKISAGSDGKVAWRQTPWHDSHASRGPPRPLRRCLQGLDPRSTANLFSSSICVGEKTINKEDCFVLRLEAESSTLRARSSSNVEVIRHTVWAYFSQRTGLLLQLKDSQLIRINGSGNDSVFWETTMESLIQAYRTTDGINIAHSGGTSVFLTRIGEGSDGHSRMRMEEAWTIEEVDFNIKGLSMDCFLSPADLKIEEDCGPADVTSNVPTSNARLPLKFWINPAKVGVAKVVAIDEDYLEDSEKDVL